MVSSLTSPLYGYAGVKKTEEAQMAKRINRAIELLEADQALYYDGPHTGHVLTYEQGHLPASGDATELAEAYLAALKWADRAGWWVD